MKSVFEYIEENDLEGLDRLLREAQFYRRTDVLLTSTKDGYTPLHLTALRGNNEALERLLSYGGANVNIEMHGSKLTPLHCAAEKGHDNTLELLLDHKATIDTGDSRGITPLLFAAMYGKISTMVTLLKHGANLHPENTYNVTTFSRLDDSQLHQLSNYLECNEKKSLTLRQLASDVLFANESTRVLVLDAVTNRERRFAFLLQTEDISEGTYEAIRESVGLGNLLDDAFLRSPKWQNRFPMKEGKSYAREHMENHVNELAQRLQGKVSAQDIRM